MPLRLRRQISAPDLVREVWASVTSRLGRTILTGFGTFLGVGVFVTTLGISATASGQVSADFNRLRATEVDVQDADPGAQDAPFPPDSDDRIMRLNGVESGGVVGTVRRAADVATLLRPRAEDSTARRVPIFAATPGGFKALLPRIDDGRPPSTWAWEHGSRVALVSDAVFDRLDLTSRRSTLFIDGLPFEVVGRFSDVARHPEALLGVVIPFSTASSLWPKFEQPPEVVVNVRPGAGPVVADQIRVALRPAGPDRLAVQTAIDASHLRRRIERSVQQTFYLLAALALGTGMISIANSTLLAVLQRTSEIGLRRALGARRADIAQQVIAEAAVVGALAGSLGGLAGVLATAVVAIHQEWTAAIDPLALIVAPIVGSLTGMVAGSYPAWRATTISPAEALQR